MDINKQPLIDQLAFSFLSRKEYESRITFHSFEVEKNQELKSLINKVSSVIVTKEVIEKVKLIKSAELFIKYIDLLIDELKIYFYVNSDAMVEKHFKVEFVDSYIRKLNSIIAHILKIIPEYPALNVNQDFINDYLNVFQSSKPKSVLSEDLVETLKPVAERLIEFDFSKYDFSDYTFENILSGALYNILFKIEALRNHLVLSNMHLLEDKFNIKLIEGMQLILEEKNGGTPIDQIDSRIIGNLSHEEIRDYFMKLTDYPVKKGGRIKILSKEQVNHFLKANFAGFDPQVEPNKMDTPGMKQGDIRKFIYKFYQKHTTKTRTDQYVHLLLNNFSIFNNTTFKTEKANFSR
jgi:hypothetical protein